MKKKQSISMPKKELVEEHEHLVKVLRSPSREDDKTEAGKQTKELKKYKRGEK